MTDREATLIGLKNIEFESFMDWSHDDVVGMLCDMLLEERETLSTMEFDAELSRLAKDYFMTPEEVIVMGRE